MIVATALENKNPPLKRWAIKLYIKLYYTAFLFNPSSISNAKSSAFPRLPSIVLISSFKVIKTFACSSGSLSAFPDLPPDFT